MNISWSQSGIEHQAFRDGELVGVVKYLPAISVDFPYLAYSPVTDEFSDQIFLLEWSKEWVESRV